MKTLGPFLLVLAMAGLSGCARVATPDWGNPGTADAQQRRAERFDPYPDPDAGPGDLGVRPREFEKPLAEPLRARWMLQR